MEVIKHTFFKISFKGEDSKGWYLHCKVTDVIIVREILKKKGYVVVDEELVDLNFVQPDSVDLATKVIDGL